MPQIGTYPNAKEFILSLLKAVLAYAPSRNIPQRQGIYTLYAENPFFYKPQIEKYRKAKKFIPSSPKARFSTRPKSERTSTPRITYTLFAEGRFSLHPKSEHTPTPRNLYPLCRKPVFPHAPNRNAPHHRLLFFFNLRVLCMV